MSWEGVVTLLQGWSWLMGGWLTTQHPPQYQLLPEPHKGDSNGFKGKSELTFSNPHSLGKQLRETQENKPYYFAQIVPP